MRRPALAVSLATAVLVTIAAACSGSGSSSGGAPTGGDAGADSGVPVVTGGGDASIGTIALTAQSDARIPQGGAGVVHVTIARTGSFTGDVDLTLSSATAGVVGQTTHVPGNATQADVGVSIAASVAQGPVSFSLEGVATGAPSLTATASASSFVSGQPGTLDTTFANEGTLTPLLTGETGPEAFAVQPDGKIVILTLAATLYRLNADGTLDATFARHTSVIDSNTVSVSVEKDGRVVLMGGNNSASAIAMRRYSATGAPDTAFPATFTQNYPILTGFAASPSTGKFGLVLTDPASNLSVARLGTTGASEGQAFPTAKSGVGVAMASDESLYAAGPSGPSGTRLYKVKPDFVTFDPACTDGTSALGGVIGGSTFDASFGIGVQSDGKVVLVGQRSSQLEFVRALGTCKADATYGTNGAAITTVGATYFGSTAIDANDRAIAAVYDDATGAASLVRMTTAGKLDTSFGGSGIVTIGGLAGQASPPALVATTGADGRAVVCFDNNGNGGACYRYWL